MGKKEKIKNGEKLSKYFLNRKYPKRIRSLGKTLRNKLGAVYILFTEKSLVTGYAILNDVKYKKLKDSLTEEQFEILDEDATYPFFNTNPQMVIHVKEVQPFLKEHKFTKDALKAYCKWLDKKIIEANKWKEEFEKKLKNK